MSFGVFYCINGMYLKGLTAKKIINQNKKSLKNETHRCYWMAAHFHASLFVPLELNKLEVQTHPHLITTFALRCVSPRLLTLGSGCAFPLEHFALMKSCHVSSDYDGLKEYKLLGDLWHTVGVGWGLVGGGFSLPIWGKEAHLCQKHTQRCDWCPWTMTSRQISIG